LLHVDVECALEQPRSLHQLTCSKPALCEHPLLADCRSDCRLAEEACALWVQRERAAEGNALLIEFLRGP
jgi:hypothetical protein